jgi:hypothetical protein
LHGGTTDATHSDGWSRNENNERFSPRPECLPSVGGQSPVKSEQITLDASTSREVPHRVPPQFVAM